MADHLLHATQLKTPLGIMLAIADEESLLFLDFVNREMITRFNQKFAAWGHSLGPWEIEEERWDHDSPAAFFQHEPFSFAKFERKIKKILRERSSKLQPGTSAPLQSIERELETYFLGRLDVKPFAELAAGNAVPGASGAQQRSVYVNTRAASTGATPQGTSAVELCKGFIFKTPYRMLGSDFQQATWKTILKIPYGTTQSYKEEAAALGNPAAVRAVANANGANLLAIVIPCHRVIATGGKLGGYGSGLRRKEWLLQHEQTHVLCSSFLVKP
ncbi:MAG: methylated-DNA--[protein]-cysteine S-methyltransferase [Chthoniobacterales bacterium]|nr:methylated-DNA--[protein]-cysteine S-methyltransferase [Chthoniobacterales bacterium]